MTTRLVSFFVLMITLGTLSGCVTESPQTQAQRSTKISEALALADTGGIILVSTVGVGGIPHLMVAGSLTRTGSDSVLVEEWSCPKTALNLMNQDSSSFRSTVVVVWDEARDEGYQLTGNLSIPLSSSGEPVEGKLNISVKTVLAFSQEYHSDIEAIVKY